MKVHFKYGRGCMEVINSKLCIFHTHGGQYNPALRASLSDSCRRSGDWQTWNAIKRWKTEREPGGQVPTPRRLVLVSELRAIRKNERAHLSTPCPRPPQTSTQRASLHPDVATAGVSQTRRCTFAARAWARTRLTNVLFLRCLDILSAAIYLRAWRCHLLFEQWMVLSGKTPDYNQRGNRSETNSSVAMETVGTFFFSLQTPVNASFHFDFFFFFFLLLLLIFNIYIFFKTINLGPCELEGQHIQFLWVQGALGRTSEVNL